MKTYDKSNFFLANCSLCYLYNLMDLIHSLLFTNFIKFHSISLEFCYNTYLMQKNDLFQATKNKPYFSSLKGNIDMYFKNYLFQSGMSF